MQLTELFPLARESVSDPRRAFRRLLDMRLGPEVLWPAFFAVALLSVILLELTVRADAAMSSEEAGSAPFVLAAIMTSTMLVLAIGINVGGRIMGGTGEFAGAMLLVIWLQFILGCLQAVQLVALVLMPFVAGLIGLAGLALTFWLMTGFVAELHGFPSRPKVFVGILIGMLGCSLGLIVLLGMLGIPLRSLMNV